MNYIRFKHPIVNVKILKKEITWKFNGLMRKDIFPWPSL